MLRMLPQHACRAGVGVFFPDVSTLCERDIAISWSARGMLDTTFQSSASKTDPLGVNAVTEQSKARKDDWVICLKTPHPK